jgi:16S rRNA (cytosine967-C5)-methyltransferase
LSGISPARRVAFDVLLAVKQGGYASDLLRRRGQDLGPQDAGLAHELVFGALRRQPQLDFLLQSHIVRPLEKLDAEVVTALRIGALQLHYLERVPAHAIVSDSVSLVKRARKRSAMGMVNAVLRKVASADLPQQWPDQQLQVCQPSWLLERWKAAFGEQRAIAIGEAFQRKPDVYVHVPAGCSATDYPHCQLQPTEVEGCYRLVQGSARNAGLRQMDISSQWVAGFVRPLPGEAVLDLCAAPGNKTTVIASRATVSAACDLHLSRLRAMREPIHPRVQLDATKPLPFRCKFPWILLDAPCSGTGTLGRNPEIRWRLRQQDIVACAYTQQLVLQNALALLAPNGTLIYSTCSLEAEENECIVADLCHDYAVRRFHRLPGETLGDGFFVAVVTRLVRSAQNEG